MLSVDGWVDPNERTGTSMSETNPDPEEPVGDKTPSDAVQMDVGETEDGAASDDSQETTFSSTTEKSNPISAKGDRSEDELETKTLLGSRKKGRYPYGPLFFIMMATAGQR